MRINLEDVTFLIPIRIDSIVRLENLIMGVSYLLKSFHTNITVLEASNYENGVVRKLLGRSVDYMFVEDKDPVFYRTKYLNVMTERAKTSFIGIWDSDVVIPKCQIIDAVNNLRMGIEIGFPYDGDFRDTTEVVREYYFNNREINFLLRNKRKMPQIYGAEAKGGAILVNKVAYIIAGKENERYYGWGPEDYDRYERWKAFGYNIYRSSGCLFHLTHPRGGNSSFRSTKQADNTSRELFITQVSSKEEILLSLDVGSFPNG